MASDGKALRILLLGGTSEGNALGRKLAEQPDVVATLSFAGRTAAPVSPLAVRIGGFGGVPGLRDYLARESVDLLIDATHPFAAQMSRNAIAAAAEAGVPLLAVERAPWIRVEGDDWDEHASIEEAIAALPAKPQRVFSALGRSALAALAAAPQNHYVIRVVDPVPQPAVLPHATIIAARGPFRIESDIALLREHGIQCVLAKNAGGDAAYAKIEAARRLGLKVHMVRRPKIAERPVIRTVDEAMSWIAAHQKLRADRGV